jgi:hypothetical protein
MRNFRLFAAALLVCAITMGPAYSSGPNGIYARIDKVVLEPNPNSPDRIQVWGVFSIAAPAPSNTYGPAARGYLYFKLDSNADATRNEWNDLKQVAGTGQIVVFGYAYDPPLLRRPDQKPDTPETYHTNIGVQKARGDADNPPVRAIMEFKD